MAKRQERIIVNSVSVTAANRADRSAGAVAGPLSRGIAALSLSLVVTLLGTGCASAPKPARISGDISASADVNPSLSKRPSPLLVRMYELKSATAFNNADFVSLFQRDQAELGADLLGREEIMLSPGESRPLAKTLAPDTRFIGVLGAFRDLERARWRSVIPVQPGQTLNVRIRADELSIAATVSK